MAQRVGLDVDTLTIRIPMRLQRRGGRKLIMTPEGAAVPTPKCHGLPPAPPMIPRRQLSSNPPVIRPNLQELPPEASNPFGDRACARRD